jgi:hypothetical protein
LESDAWGEVNESLQHLMMMAEATLSSTMDKLRQITEQRPAGAQADVVALEHRMKYILSVAALLVAGLAGALRSLWPVVCRDRFRHSYRVRSVWQTATWE